MTDTDAVGVSRELIDSWLDPNGSVALYLKQKLLPVEGEGGVIFPPTYADIGYNIDTLADGTKVATIDSVGSQANRMEPVFKCPPYSDLVPQIEIEIPLKDENGVKYVDRRSLLDLPHRAADAVVMSCPQLAPLATKAFSDLRKHNDAAALCSLAPTSLVFGVWDSRGKSGQKRPRLVRSIIRAWDVQPLHAAAQFNSVWKLLDADQQEELKKAAKGKPADKGFADAPAIFRKTSKNMPEFRDGAPNPERRVLGGVATSGPIARDVTINLVALRSIKAGGEEATSRVQRYLLGLVLIAATADIEFFLREGCNLRLGDEQSWKEVPRRGEKKPVDLTSETARGIIGAYAISAAEMLKPSWPETLVYTFDLKEAKKLCAKKSEEEEEAGG
ncbi:MAG: type I-U CRISPR-associated RAMP protein Csb1/Cas7u [Rhodospirillales bacterium]|nr:type I-U CRISPR-associated RAMP protein Csb1/Cas7u [Rhodospirillales bacterium]